MFERIAGVNNASRSGGAAFLLHDMGQLVGNQPAALRFARLVLSCSEDDMFPQGVGQAVDHACRIGRPFIGVHPHAGEVVAEATLHERSGSLIKLPPRGLHNGVGNCRHTVAIKTSSCRRPADVASPMQMVGRGYTARLDSPAR
jgi:hypothetical protein